MIRSSARILLAAAVFVGAWIPRVALAADAANVAVVSEPVALNGSGGDSGKSLMNSAASPLYDSEAGLTLTYLALGDRDAREGFAQGLPLDFVISGRPMTSTDIESLESRDVEVGSAPISVGALVFLFHASHTDGMNTYYVDPQDPETVTRGVYDGPVRIPSPLLASGLLDKADAIWSSSELKTALGLAEGWNFVASGPIVPAVSSLPGANGWYLDTFVRNAAPDAWAAKAKELLMPEASVTEAWPFLTTPQRPSSAELAGIVANGRHPGADVFPPGGSMAPVAPGDARTWLDKGTEGLSLLEVQNGAGEWVAPTPEAISAAAALGESDGLPALERQVPGAYPLTWINRIYVPLSGLDPAKANALATMIRFSAASGQEALAALGEGRLPAGLADEAFDLADAVVKGNCKADGHEVVTLSGSGGPYWPKAAKAPGSAVTLCATPVTQATVAEATTPGSSSSGYSWDSSSSVAGSSVTGTGATVSAAPIATTSNAGGEQAEAPPSFALTAMPLDMPHDGRGVLDRFATLLVGAAIYVSAMSAVRAVRRRRA